MQWKTGQASGLVKDIWEMRQIIANWTGTMQINRVDGEPLLKSGEWQYDPWWNCWYLNGESFPAEICRKVL